MTIVTRNTRLICSETGEYPIYLTELSTRVPGTIFPSTIDAAELYVFGYEVVVDEPAPSADVVVEAKPKLRDGTWYRTWEARNFSDTEVADNLAAAKTDLLSRIEAFRVAQFEKGFPYEVDGQIYHVQIRTTDRQNISSIRVIAKEAIAQGGDLPVSFRVYENVTVNLTAAEFVTLADTTFLRVTEGYQVAWVLKDQVAQATTIAELPTIPAEMFQSVEAFQGA